MMSLHLEHFGFILAQMYQKQNTRKKGAWENKLKKYCTVNLADGKTLLMMLLSFCHSVTVQPSLYSFLYSKSQNTSVENECSSLRALMNVVKGWMNFMYQQIKRGCVTRKTKPLINSTRANHGTCGVLLSEVYIYEPSLRVWFWLWTHCIPQKCRQLQLIKQMQ